MSSIRNLIEIKFISWCKWHTLSVHIVYIQGVPSMSCHNSWNLFLGSCAVLCPYPNLPVCASASKSLKSPRVCDMLCPCNISVVFSIWHLDYVLVPSLRSVGKILATVLIWINAKESEQDDFPPSLLFACLLAGAFWFEEQMKLSFWKVYHLAVIWWCCFRQMAVCVSWRGSFMETKSFSFMHIHFSLSSWSDIC